MSLFASRLREGPPAVALEITPPKTRLPGVLTRRASLAGDAVEAINVIQRPGRLPSLDACIELRAQGYSPVWHLVCRGRTRESIAADLIRARESGIDQVLCILGDHMADPEPDAPTVRDVVAMATDAIPGALVGATFNQYVPDRAKAIRNLAAKHRAGATYVQTQPAFDAMDFAATASELRAACPGLAVVPMVMPIPSVGALTRIEERLSLPVPTSMRDRVAAGPSEAWDAFADTLRDLVDRVQGVALMTFEMDPPPGTGEHIRAALQRAGLLP